LKKADEISESAAWIQTGEQRKYAYNLPWTSIILGMGIFGSLALGVARLARNHTGLSFAGLMVLSGLLMVLALLGPIRRVFFPRVLTLDDNAIYFPHGFSGRRTDPIRYAEIVRAVESNRRRLNLWLKTTGRGFCIDGPSLGSPEDYIAVRTAIFKKALIDISPDSGRIPEAETWRELPEPILHWIEPVDWPRYRTKLVTSRPGRLRLARELWFFARCLAIITIPWMILHFFGYADAPSSYLPLALAVSFFFTWLHWYGVIHPASRKVLKFRINGITIHYGKQFADYTYQAVSGWTIVERSFDGRALNILLLEIRNRKVPCALPDAETRDRVAQILGDKHVPPNPSLKPSWEA
jgi:hypothetical protein